MMTLTEYRKRWKKALRGSFFEAVWDGNEPAELIREAEAAGIEMSLADQLRDEVGKLKAAIPAATDAPAREAAFLKAQAAFKTQQAKVAARISALEDELDAAGCALNELGRAFEEGQDAVIFLACSDLIPGAAELPAAVVDYQKKHADRLVHPPRVWQRKTD